MTKDELDYELRKLTDSELKHLNEMKQFFGFKSNEDIFNNYEKLSIIISLSIIQQIKKV